MLHIHVAFFAPAGTCYMTQPGADQHQSAVAVRKCSDGPCPPFNLTVDSFQHIVCADSGPMLAGKPMKVSDSFSKYSFVHKRYYCRPIKFAITSVPANFKYYAAMLCLLLIIFPVILFHFLEPLDMKTIVWFLHNNPLKHFYTLRDFQATMANMP